MTENFEPKTKNYNHRKPVMLIVHGISTPLSRARDILSGRTEWEASAHYLITQAGEVEHYVAHKDRAWHAGAAYWAGFEDINSLSIGIELQGSEELEDKDDQRFDIVHYTEGQLEKLAEILQLACTENKIASHHILGHQDIMPYRKTDPGPNFDWAVLAKKGFGIWHDLEKSDKDPVISDEKQIAEFSQKLTFFGYDPRPNADGKGYDWVIRAFQTHFLPWNICGQVTAQSVQALDILLKKKFGI